MDDILRLSEQLALTLLHLLGQRIAVLGTSGMGKSNTVALLIEALAPHLPFAIIDPHDEYYGLCQQFTFLRAGKAPGVDIEAGPDQAAQLAEFSFNNGVSIILSMLLMDEDERLEFVYNFCNRLWELNLLVKRPYGVVLDEAQNFIPQSGARTPALKKLKQFFLEGRKFGFTTILSSQRSAEVNKTILGQCGIAFLHGVDILPDVEAYAGMLPYTNGETKKIALNLGVGECIVKVKPDGNAQYLHPVKMHKRLTFDASKTPTTEAAALLQARQLDASMIDSLREAIVQKPQDAEAVEDDSELARLRELDVLHIQLEDKWNRAHAQAQTEIERLNQELSEKTQEIARLTQCIEQMQQAAPAPQQLMLLRPTVEEWDGRSELATTRAITKQQREFDALLRDIRSAAKQHRLALVYLTQRESQVVEERLLVRQLGYSYSTFVNRRPVDFERMKLIQRKITSDRGSYNYQSTVRQAIKERCPDLDADELVDKICKLERV